MFQFSPRSSLTFLAPYTLLVIGYFSLSLVNLLSADQQATLRLIPYSLFVVSAGISLYFGRSRIFYLSLLLALLHWTLTSYYPYVDTQQKTRLLLVLGVLVPLNLAIMAFVRDRGLNLLLSYLMASVLILQVALVAEIMNGGLAPWLLRFDQLFDAWSWPFELLPRLPKPVMLSLLISTVLIGTRIFFRMTPLNNALMVVLVAVGLAFYFVDSANTVITLFVVSGLVALLSLLQHSYDMAYRDELTGLLGRRALNERFLRLGGRYCLVMVDVDHFKKFNDTYGHDVGDQVLKMLAGQLDRTGGAARAYRYGGEEFVLVFEGKSLAQIEPHLEDLRARVARYPMKVRDINRPKDSKKGKTKREKRTISGPLKVTVSIGAAQRNEKMKTVSEVMSVADKALYRAKNAGRNRVIISS